MSGRTPEVTKVFGNDGSSFRDVGPKWVTMPEHLKDEGMLVLGGGKTFHPNSPKNWDEPQSWSQDQAYFPFSYYKPDPAMPKGQPCPGSAPSAGSKGASKIDTWCTLDEPDEAFYDYTLASHVTGLLDNYTASGDSRPFAFFAGFARPHVPWRVPARFAKLYPNVSLAQDPLFPAKAPLVAYHQQGFYIQNGSVYLPEPQVPVPDEIALLARQHYYASVSWMDEQVGRILAALDAHGLYNDTVIVIHGDHGWVCAVCRRLGPCHLNCAKKPLTTPNRLPTPTPNPCRCPLPPPSAIAATWRTQHFPQGDQL